MVLAAVNPITEGGIALAVQQPRQAALFAIEKIFLVAEKQKKALHQQGFFRIVCRLAAGHQQCTQNQTHGGTHSYAMPRLIAYVGVNLIAGIARRLGN